MDLYPVEQKYKFVSAYTPNIHEFVNLETGLRNLMYMRLMQLMLPKDCLTIERSTSRHVTCRTYEASDDENVTIYLDLVTCQPVRYKLLLAQRTLDEAEEELNTA